MLTWENNYCLAGFAVKMRSSVGDLTPLLPAAMSLFRCHGGTGADLHVHLEQDDRADADPLKAFFPPAFRLRRDGEELLFEKSEGKGGSLGKITRGYRRAALFLPSLERSWRLPEEEGAVREALQAFLKGCLQWLLLERGGTLLHAAGVAVRGRGFVFAGHTRAGKTTMARNFPDEEVLGDDLVALRREEEGFALYGTPWPGREKGIVAYGGVPLVAVFNLHPEMPGGLYPQAPAEATAELMANAPRTGDLAEESKLLEILSSLTTSVSIFRLSMRLGEDVMRYLGSLFLPEGFSRRPKACR